MSKEEIAELEKLHRSLRDKRQADRVKAVSGTGKTHLATALGFAACCQGYKVRFFGCTALVIQLLEAEKRNNYKDC